MHSIIYTIHNKDFLLKQGLDRIKKYTTQPYELIIVLDGCTDNSQSIVKEFVYNNRQITTCVLKVDNIFETKSNNIGMKHACDESEYFIIIQDDQLINEPDWNVRLTKPFRVFNDVFAVTSEAAHNWIDNPESKHQYIEKNLNYCRCDIINHVDHAGRPWGLKRDTFAIRSCVNRGPLAIDRQDMIKMNYLDQKFYPLDMDDHDLCIRMRKKIGKQVGCYWIDFITKYEWGGTHASGGNKPWYYEANHKNTKLFWKRHKEFLKENRIIEDRPLQ